MNNIGAVNSCPVEVFGIRYNSIKEAYNALDFPCCYETLVKKLRTVKDKGREMESILYGQGRTVYILGVRCKSFNEACRKFGTDINTGQVRRKRGWSTEDAVLGKAKGKRVLNLEYAKVIVKDRLEEGWAYDEISQFFYGDGICDLDSKADEVVKRFLDICKKGMEPFEAYVRVFD